jgi:TRAP-type C4-dicarboxylate transport system permease small subunit
MKKYLAIGQKLENTILSVAFIIMTLASFSQVVNRNLVGAGISWFEELARYCMVYMALLGTEVGLRDGTQIAITAVIDKFKGVPRALLEILAKLLIVAFSFAVFWTSFVLLERQIASGQFSPGLEVPMYVPYFALPLSFGIITLVQAATLITMIAALFSPKTEASEGGVA